MTPADAPYKVLARELKARRNVVQVHDAKHRNQPGRLLKFSDRLMQVDANGSLVRVSQIVNGPPPPKQSEPWFTITNAGDACTIRIFGYIGAPADDPNGVNCTAFINELNGIPRDSAINLRIHSPGGYVWDALPIYNYLRARREQVTAHIDGIAASCASFIAMAAGKIVMPKTARMMIHDAQGCACGTSAELKAAAELLDRETNNIADIYAERTGLTRKQVLAMMAKTTWFNGTEAKAQKFCDEVTDAAVLNCTDFDLSVFNHVPEDLRNSNPQQPTAHTMRDQIIALLRRHGINVQNTATDAELGTLLAQLENRLATEKPADLQVVLNEIKDLKAKLTPPPTPAPAPAPTNVTTITPEAFAALQRQIEGERTVRVTNELNAIIADGRGYIDPKAALPRALADEKYLAELRAMPQQRTGAEPVRNVITNCGNPLLENYGKMTAGAARSEFRVLNFIELKKAHNEFMPRNANTIDTALVPDALADGIVVVANNRLSMLGAFARNISLERLAPKKTIQVRKAVSGSTTQTNATNFEQGDSNLDNIQVSVNQYTQSFQLSNQEINQGHQLAHLAQVNANAFTNKLSDVITALMTTANYGTAIIIGAAANFDPDDLKPVLAAAKNYGAKNLVLDGGHLAYLLPRDKNAFKIGEQGAYGFDLISEQNRWTGAATNAAGFVCGPDALVFGAALPINQPAGEFLEQGTVQIAQGINVAYSVWYSRSGRVNWASYDVMFGGAVGDETQADVLVTA